jgi:hypothetical protein
METDWEPDDLAPRLALAKGAALRTTAKQGPQALETYLRGVVGHPPQQRRPVDLDSQDSADLGTLLADSEERVTRLLDRMSEEELDLMEVVLLKIDPSGILAEEFRGMAPI